jgi:hypothetical protein
MPPLTANRDKYPNNPPESYGQKGQDEMKKVVSGITLQLHGINIAVPTATIGDFDQNSLFLSTLSGFSHWQFPELPVIRIFNRSPAVRDWTLRNHFFF